MIYFVVWGDLCGWVVFFWVFFFLGGGGGGCLCVNTCVCGRFVCVCVGGEEGRESGAVNRVTFSYACDCIWSHVR